jgi:hypothetical protein
MLLQQAEPDQVCGRTCPGSVPQSVTFAVQGTCGATGTVTISVAAAGQCGLTLTETAGVGLPVDGTFNGVGAETAYEVAQGNWDIQNTSTATGLPGAGLDCSSEAASAGVVNLTCTMTECSGSDAGETCVAAEGCQEVFTLMK